MNEQIRTHYDNEVPHRTWTLVYADKGRLLSPQFSVLAQKHAENGVHREKKQHRTESTDDLSLFVFHVKAIKNYRKFSVWTGKMALQPAWNKGKLLLPWLHIAFEAHKILVTFAPNMRTFYAHNLAKNISEPAILLTGVENKNSQTHTQHAPFVAH